MDLRQKAKEAPDQLKDVVSRLEELELVIALPGELRVGEVLGGNEPPTKKQYREEEKLF